MMGRIYRLSRPRKWSSFTYHRQQLVGPSFLSSRRPLLVFVGTASVGLVGLSSYPYKDSTTTACSAAVISNQEAITAIHLNDKDNHQHHLSPLERIQQALHLLWEALLVSLRGTEVGLRFAPLILLTPASVMTDLLLRLSPVPTEKNWVADVAWWYTTYAVQHLGPSFVKLCQWIATRRDIFPPHVCDRLSRLHDDGIPHSWEYTIQALKEAFGEDYEGKGLVVSNEIVGCGSAAQVYMGTLKTTPSNSPSEKGHTDRTVAVKVLHPNFQQNVERDLWLMETVAKLLHALPSERIKMINLPRASATFGSVLRRQADLRIEADNLEIFRRNFAISSANSNNSTVVFPQPLMASEQVLVEEYIDNATPISHYLRDHSAKGSELRKALAGPLLRAFLKMIFYDNFVHSDLHPGNVQVVDHEKIVFLDAGIATSLSPNDQKNLKDLFRAVLVNDGYTAGRLMVERARYERCSQVEGGVDAFAAGIQGIVSEFHERRGLTLGSVRIGSLLSQVLDLCRIHGVEINPAMATIIISTLVLEGLGRSLEPNLNLIDASIPFVLGKGLR